MEMVERRRSLDGSNIVAYVSGEVVVGVDWGARVSY